MWSFLAREAAKRIGGAIVANKIAGVDEPNGPEAYADRIKRDFRLHDYADAWALYDSDRAYWENYYRPQPNGPANNAFVRDSAAVAGIPSRNNVFEHGFPESGSVQPSIGRIPSIRTPNGFAWNNEFVRDSVAAAGVPSRNNVFEHGFPGSGSLQPPAGDARPSPSNISPRGALPIPFFPLAFQRAPRGLPALLAEAGAFDPSGPDVPPSGGLLGLIQEHLRNR
ncbi:hypothetical protein [Bradyrhizobium sp. BWA-3-5]|uniref:hypothetical protein n=1 Tax=Bradyrhizobium sp. BWA-3-5 TaxID=3080013 RepID=UPI00293E18B0|nr:hypothetical protein [Bradyrhizobium sp. BWA-3-5]WOH68100.1 hypothetical protein RX331_10455 [Bradyrhizobium sp. BWA-3-5]